MSATLNVAAGSLTRGGRRSLPLLNYVDMNRLDYYDILPKGMDAYLASHGRHFSKPMLEWAVGMMRDRNNRTVPVPDKKQLDTLMSQHGVSLEHNDGFYDASYVWAMIKADYYGSSISDDTHALLYIKDYIDDPDGNPTRAFDEFYANCLAKGIDIPWEDMI